MGPRAVTCGSGIACRSLVSRIVPVVAHAIVVFGDEHKASHWVSTPLPLFNGRAPSELLETEEGIQLVEQTLTRIEHNVFS